MKYDEIIELAKMLRFGSTEAKFTAGTQIHTLDNDGLVDVLETSREILFENSDDDEIISSVTHMISFIYAEQSNRIVKSGFGKVVDFFLKK